MIGKLTMRLGLMIAAVMSVGLVAAGPIDPGTRSKTLSSDANPLNSGFVENKGQWGSTARFFSGGRGLDVWVTDRSIKYDFHQPVPVAPSRDRLKRTPPAKRSGHVVELEFLGTADRPSAQGIEAQEGLINFIKGRMAFRDVQSYREAQIGSLYPGIDLRMYRQEGSPRFDLIVAPGADPNQIRFRYNGTTVSRLLDANTIAFDTRYGQRTLSDLFAYQEVNGERKAVKVGFKKLSDGTFGFNVGAFDSSKPLVIDPVVYSTLFGAFAPPLSNFGIDIPNAVAVDRFNAVYVGGSTNSVFFPITNGAYDNVIGGVDAFITKFRSDASGLIFSTYIGGSGVDEALGIAVDSQGRPTIVGYTTSTNDIGSLPFPTTPGAPQESYGGSISDGFVARLSNDGRTLDFGTYLGGNNSPFVDEVITSIGIDGADNLYVGGYTDAPDYPTSGVVLQPEIGGDVDGIVVRINQTGALDYATYLGGTSTDAVFALAVNPAGEAHVTGLTASADFRYTAGAFDTDTQGTDAFVSKLNPSGTALEYSTALGGSSDDNAAGIALDNSGNAFVLGSTSSVDFPRTAGVYDETYNPDSENFVTKLALDGRNLVYSTFLNSVFSVRSIGVDDLGVAYIVGNGFNTAIGQLSDDPTFNGSPVPGLGDAIINALDDAGANLIYSSYFGGQENDAATAVVVDRSRNAIFVGVTDSWAGNGRVAFPTTPGAFKETMAPDASATTAFFDGFLMKVKVRQSPVLQGFTLNPSPVAGTESTTATVTLSGPASPGGAAIRLASTNENVARPVDGAGNLLDLIVIPEGQTQITFQVTTSDVVNSTTVTFSAELEGDTRRANLTVAPWLTNVTLSPNTIVGGNRVTGRVNLFRPAPAGMTVTVSSSDANLAYAVDGLGNRINAFVVPTGQTTATFDILTRGVDVQSTVTVLAKITTPNLQVTRSQVLIIRPATLRAVSFDPNRVNGGEQSTGTVLMDGEVGPTPVTVNLTLGTAGNPPVDVTLPTPASVTIRQVANNVEAGKSARFTVTAGIPTANSFRNVIATRPGTDPLQTRQATLFVDVNSILRVNLSSNSVVGGATVTGSVDLENPAAAAGVALTVTTSDPVHAPINGTQTSVNLTVPAGANRSPDFTVNTKLTRVARNVTITASKPGYTSRTATLAVRAINFTMRIAPNAVVGGSENPTLTVTLNEPAPEMAVRISFANSNPAAVTVSQAVQFQNGETEKSFTLATKSVTTPQVATITGTLNTLPTPIVQSQTLTINPLLVGLTIDPASVVGGNNATGTATLTANAGPSGVSIALSSDNANAIVPPTVLVPSGSNNSRFTIRTKEVAADQTATITARTPAGLSATATLRVLSIAVTVTLTPNSVIGGQNSTGRVSISSPARANYQFDITSSNTAVARTTTNQVTINTGLSQSNAFTINTSVIAADTNVTFTARFVQTGRTGTAVLQVAALRASVTLDPTSVVGGNNSNGTVTLNGPAGPGGVVIRLSSNLAVATVPATVSIPSGQSTARFTVRTVEVPNDVTATIRALTPVNVAGTANLLIRSVAVTLTLTPDSVIGGQNTTGRVGISSPALSTYTFSISSNSTIARPTVTSVTIGAGQTQSSGFAINTSVVGSETNVTLTARFDRTGRTGTATLRVRALEAVVALDPTTVIGGNRSNGTVTLNGPAGPGGVVIRLSSNLAAATTPTSITIPSGQTTGRFTVNTVEVPNDTTATIRALTPANVARTAALRITAIRLSMTITPSTVTGGQSASGRITLSSPARVNYTFTLGSNVPSVAQPAAGSTSVSSGFTQSNAFGITTSPVGTDTTATITGRFTLTGQTVSATLRVNSPRLTDLILNPDSVIGGDSTVGIVRIGSVAPTNGLPIQVRSSNTAIATVPATVTIPANSTATSFTIRTTIQATDMNVSISVTHAGQTISQTLQVLAPTLVSIQFNPATVIGGNSSTGTVTLDRAAPAGGILITLSKSPNSTGSGFVTIPASVTIPAGQRSATFTATTQPVSRTVSSLISATFAQRGQEVNTVLTMQPR